MRFRGLSPLLLLFVCGWMPTVQAAEPPPFPTVLQLIADLGSSDFAARESAEKRLDSFGNDAVPALRAARRHPDPEIAQRVRRLIDRIEEREDALRLQQTKRRTLNLCDKPLREILNELNSTWNTEIKLRDTSGKLADLRLTLIAERVDFWEALDLLCRTGKLSEQCLFPGIVAHDEYYPVAPSHLNAQGWGEQVVPRRVIVLMDRQPPELATSRSGAVRIRSLPRDFPCPVCPSEAGDIVVPLEIKPAPEIDWRLTQMLSISRAVDNRGQELKQPLPYFGGNPDFRSLEELDGTRSTIVISELTSPWIVPVRLRGGKLPSYWIEELQGTVWAEIMTPEQPLMTLADLPGSIGKKVTCPRGGFMELLEYKTLKSGAVQVRLLLEEPLTTHRQIMEHPRLTMRKRLLRDFVKELHPLTDRIVLLDSSGHAYSWNGVEVHKEPNDNNDRYDITVTFASRPNTNAEKLAYCGRRLVPLEIPFTLKKIPLNEAK